jgi:hypothetical protein
MPNLALRAKNHLRLDVLVEEVEQRLISLVKVFTVSLNLEVGTGGHPALCMISPTSLKHNEVSYVDRVGVNLKVLGYFQRLRVLLALLGVLILGRKHAERNRNQRSIVDIQHRRVNNPCGGEAGAFTGRQRSDLLTVGISSLVSTMNKTHLCAPAISNSGKLGRLAFLLYFLNYFLQLLMYIRRTAQPTGGKVRSHLGLGLCRCIWRKPSAFGILAFKDIWNINLELSSTGQKIGALLDLRSDSKDVIDEKDGRGGIVRSSDVYLEVSELAQSAFGIVSGFNRRKCAACLVLRLAGRRLI